MKQIIIKAPFFGVSSTLRVKQEDLQAVADAVALAIATSGNLSVTRFGNVTIEANPAPVSRESPVVKKRKAAGLEG